MVEPLSERILVIMRHGEADSNSPTGRDHDRPLTARGLQQAAESAQLLVDEWGLSLDAVISSTALRASQTADALKAPQRLNQQGLYLADWFELLQAAQSWDRTWRSLVVVGHNPHWSEIASSLGGGQLRLNTAAMVALQGEGETWVEALESRSFRLLNSHRSR